MPAVEELFENPKEENQMNVNREEFLNDLEMVQSGLSPREFIEQSSCFVFDDGRVMTFNDEVACQKKIGVSITGAIQATSLLDILQKLEDPILSITENEKGELEFKGKKKAFGITKDAEIFLPINQVEVPEKWRPLPKEFTEAVGLVQHCVSGDESQFLLTCIHIHPDYIEACDNFLSDITTFCPADSLHESRLKWIVFFVEFIWCDGNACFDAKHFIRVTVDLGSTD